MFSTARQDGASRVEFRPVKGIEVPPRPPRRWGVAAWALLPSGLGALVVPMTRLFPGWPWPAIVRMGMLAVLVVLPIVVVVFWRQATVDHRRRLTGADGDAG